MAIGDTITHLINVLLLDTGILQYLLDRLHSLAEEIHVKLFELGTGEGLREVVTILEGLDFDASGLLAREGSLGLLNLALQFTHSAEIAADIGTSLLLVALDEVVNYAVIEIFTTKVGITSGSQDLKDTVFNGKKGDVESSTTEIINNDLRFLALLVKTVGDGGGGRLVDNTKDSKTGDSSCIFSSLALSVVKV